MTSLKQKKVDQDLKMAVLEGNFQEVERLMWDGANALAGVEKFEDALSCAAMKGHLDILEFLHEKAGAKLHKGVLLWAVDNNQSDIVEYLQAHLFDILQDDALDFRLGVAYDYLEMREQPGASYPILEDKKVYISETVKRVLEAQSDGQYLEKQVALDPEFKQALKTGDLAIVKEICASGVDLDAHTGHALSVAAQNNQLEIVKYFVEERHVDADISYGMPLQLAAWQGHLDIVKYLIEDAGVNLHGIDGKEPALHHALLTKQKDTSEYLIKKGANLSVVMREYDEVPEQYKRIWSGFCQTKRDILKAKNLQAFKNIEKHTPAVRRRPAHKV